MQPMSILSTTNRTQEKNTIESYKATLSKFRDQIGNSRQLDGISSEEVLSFLNKITEGGKQQTKHGRYSHLKAFFNFIKINFDSTFQNPCDTPMLRKLYRPGKPNHWSIVEKETIDEIIFRTPYRSAVNQELPDSMLLFLIVVRVSEILARARERAGKRLPQSRSSLPTLKTRTGTGRITEMILTC